MAEIKRFIPLEGVKKGDLLLTYDGTEEVVETIEFVPSTEDVYNLEVSGNHNYYAEKILVHNKETDKGNFAFGGYVGKDSEVKPKVQHDLDSWASTKKSINQLSDMARRISNKYADEGGEAFELKRGTATTTFEAGTQSRVKDFLSQQRAANVQSGQTGLASGTAQQDIASGKEAFQNVMAQTQQEHTGTLEGIGLEEKAEEFGVESSLYDIAQKQTDLYTAYLRDMQSGGVVPRYDSGYTGGTNWTNPATGDPPMKMGLGCFPADIKVDGKEISKIEIGDMVSSYNEETGIVEKAEVIETFKHKHDDGYLVINGRIKATANHPFYIRRNV